MNKEEVLNILKQHVKNQKLVNHCIAVGAIMKALAKRFGEDETRWEALGILHDIDYEKTKDYPEKHGLLAREILEGRVEEEIIKAIERHNPMTGNNPETLMEKALVASDAVSGLIVATALVMPSKRLDEVRLETLKNKFKQKDFARAVSRENILICEEIGLTLNEFLEISLNALKEISKELGF
jgi:putative nucleotidyltransferase with HDIG domain